MHDESSDKQRKQCLADLFSSISLEERLVSAPIRKAHKAGTLANICARALYRNCYNLDHPLVIIRALKLPLLYCGFIIVMHKIHEPKCFVELCEVNKQLYEVLVDRLFKALSHH